MQLQSSTKRRTGAWMRRVFAGMLALVIAPAAIAHAGTAPDPQPPIDAGIELGAVPSTPDFAATRVISLKEALEIACAENIDLALARADEAVAGARADGAVYGLLPSLDLDAGASHARGLVQGVYGDFRDVDSESHRAGAAVAYGVNIGAQIKGIAAARNELSAAVFMRLDAEQRLMLRVVELYENLVLAAIGVNIADQTVADSTEFEHIASVRAKGGVGLGADAARTHALLAESRQRLVQARTVWKDTSVRLAVTLRLDPWVVLNPAVERHTVWSLVSPGDFRHLEECARRRPDVESARRIAEAANDHLNRAWWDLLGPRITAEARYSGIGGRGDAALTDAWSRASTAAGSVGRSVFAWENVANAAPGNLGPALSGAVGSGGRAAAAYQSLLESPAENYGFNGRTNLGISLNWSLSFAKTAAIREGRRVKEQAALRATQLEEAAAGEVVAASHDLQGASEQIMLAQEELSASSDNHRMHLARLQAGIALVLEVVDAQDAIERARLHLARYITDCNLAQARMLAAAGLIGQVMHGHP